MKCQYHTGQVKTHICLKSLCKHSVVCPICIANDHQNHLTIELLQFKRGVANMISQHDNPDPLPHLGDLVNQILKVETQLQDQLKKLYQKKKDTIEIHQFKLVEQILREEQPTLTQLMALKRVGQQMIFYKDDQNQWIFSIVADNQDYKNIDKVIQNLRCSVKEHVSKLTNVLSSLSSLSKLIGAELLSSQEEQFQSRYSIEAEGSQGYKRVKSEIHDINKEISLEISPSPKQEQQQSLELLRMLENNSDDEDSPPKEVSKISKYLQKIINMNSQRKQQLNLPLQLQPDRKYISLQPLQSQNEHVLQVREKRKYVKKADKLTQDAPKRIYRRKTYNRFKFNSDQCIGIFREMLD